MARRRWDVLGATVVAAALVAAGCGSGGVDEAEPAPTTVAPSTTTGPTPDTTVPSEEEAVLAAYQGYWDTWLAANDPPDPNHPDLERYATGTALARATAAITNNRDVGQLTRLGPDSLYRHVPIRVEIAGDQATLSDCSVDDAVVIASGSGLVLDDSVISRRMSAVLVRSAEGWRVEDVVILQEWEGVAKCAA